MSNIQDNDRSAFVSPITPKYRDVFYSSIPVEWSDPTEGCIVCLVCARETFAPRDRPSITINGKVVN